MPLHGKANWPQEPRYARNWFKNGLLPQRYDAIQGRFSGACGIKG
jgi:hypothetical protein